LMSEVAQFQDWAAAYPPERRGGEWECDYDQWPNLYDAVLEFVDARPFSSWSAEELRAVLYAVARDNEIEHLAHEIRSLSTATLLALAAAAVEIGEPDAKWQLAEELGRIEEASAEAERLLLTLARDENEYVRRRSLAALARLGSLALEELALAAWQRPDENQQWARMMVLWCLHRVGSPHLEPLLTEAEQDERPNLSNFAKKVRRGEVDL
jgi:hypothetical protein